MTLVSTITIGAGGASEILFSNIPQSGTDLLVLFSMRSNQPDTIGDIYPQLNSNTTWSNYTDYMVNGNGATAYGQAIGVPYAWLPGSTITANTFGNGQIYVQNYAATVSKRMMIDAVTENAATAVQISSQVVRYAPTAAITSLKISGGNTFPQYSMASLYTITNGSGGATVS